ncbi:MAG: hypothetical protein R3B53_01615 [Candidatus Paceibacterota bacterium]
MATVVDYSQNLNLTRPLLQPGLHNRLNAAGAETVAKAVGIKSNYIETALTNLSVPPDVLNTKGS